MARVLPYPWSLLMPRNEAGAALSTEDCELVAPLNPETLTFFTRAEDESLPAFAGQRQAAAVLANQVLPNPGTPAGRRPGFLSTPALPFEKSDVWHVRFGSEECSIPVAGT